MSDQKYRILNVDSTANGTTFYVQVKKNFLFINWWSYVTKNDWASSKPRKFSFKQQAIDYIDSCIKLDNDRIKLTAMYPPDYEEVEL